MNVCSLRSQTFNPFVRLLFIIVAAMTGLSSCFEHVKVAQHQRTVTPPLSNTQATSLTGTVECRIIQVKMMGIPDENITVNEKDTSINVLLPEPFYPNSFSTTYILSDKNCYIPNADIPNYPCSGSWPSPTLYRGNLNNRYDPRPYKMKIRSAGDLVFGRTSDPIHVTIGEPKAMTIHVANYFSHLRSSNSPQVELVRIGDGKVKNSYASCYYSGGATPSASQINLNVHGEAGDEGTYSLKIKMADGVTAQSNQPVIISRSDRVIVTMIDQYYCCPPNAGDPKRVYGFNLTPEYQPGITIIDPDGKSTQLTVVEYEPKGRWMTVRIPNNLNVGHYMYQVTQKGIGQRQFGHFVVGDGKKPVFLYPFGAYTGVTDQTALVKAGSTFVINLYSPFQDNTKLKLTRKSDSAISYIVDVKYPQERPYSGMYPPTIVIPQTIISGEYMASLQQTLADGSILEGPPHYQTFTVSR